MSSKSPDQVIERPQFRWKVVAQIAAVFAVLWVTALGTIQFIGYWGVAVMAVLTVAALGFGLYVLRWTRKSQAIADILTSATDAKSRRDAIKQLESADSQDAIKALARAQLIAQEKPSEAMTVLEEIDLKKAPSMVQDDVRANLAFLYLVHNRAREARALADDIRLDRQPNAKAKAMYAAVVAESFSRTGKSEEAAKLLETFPPSDPAYGEMRVMLLRAQVFNYLARKKKGRAREAMSQLVAIDPNNAAAFLRKGTPTDASQVAKQALGGKMGMPQMKVQRTRMKMR